MNEKIEKSVRNTKKFWNDHKGKLAVVATITTIGAVAITRAAARTNQAFLEEKGLTEEFNVWLIAEEDE